jgi:DNA-binding beta-propeller fold protein YncE
MPFEPSRASGALTLTILSLVEFVLLMVVDAAELRVVHGWPQLPNGETLGQVSGVASDSRGNIFAFHRGRRSWTDDLSKAKGIAEQVVVVFDGETGQLLKRWGEETFVLPHGIFIDHMDHVWVTDVGRHQVFEFDHEGKLLRNFGERGVPGEDASHFNKPTDVAVAPNGSFYVSDGYGNNRVAKFSADGKFLFQWGNRGTGPGEFNLPHGVALDAFTWQTVRTIVCRCLLRMGNS